MSVANSQFDTAAIEAIVREVLRRLASAGTPNSISTNSNSTVEADNHSFECSDKVIAMQTLRGKLDNVKTLRLKPKTIVTPAVRDELRDRKIKIVFDLLSDEPTNCRTTILLGTNCNSTGNSLRDRLIADGTQVRLHVDKCSGQLATTVGNKISTTISALIVTDQPYTAACVANRNANVRAVVVRDQGELTAAKSELNPNCVVLNSGNVGRVNLSAILHQLTQ
jgi:hypothetical protein